MKVLPQALKLGVGNTGARPARIDQLAVRRVVAEQQRTDPVPAALWIAPPDDELLAGQAFRLQPCAPTGLIPTINALRDETFEAVVAGQAMKGRALANLMTVILERL